MTADTFSFMGPGDFRLYLWDARPDSPTRGHRSITVVGQSNPQAVIIPPGVVHAYKNVSETPGWVFNAPNVGNNVSSRFNSIGQRTIVARIDDGRGGFVSRNITLNVLSALARP